MAGKLWRPRQRKGKYKATGKAWYITLSPKEAQRYGLPKDKWIGPFARESEVEAALKDLDTTIEPFVTQYRRQAAPGTLSDFYQSWLKRTNVRPSTKELYKACWPHLAPLHSRRLADISRNEIRALLESLPFSKSRVKSIRSLLNHCFNQALDDELIDSTPMVNLRLKFKKPSATKAIKFWTQEQANTLLSHYPKPRFDLFYRLALHTGCRRGELLALKWQNVNFGDNTIYIASTYDRQFGERPPKTERSRRTICLRQEEMNALKEAYHESLKFVFQRPDKVEPISINSIQKSSTLCVTG